MAKKTAVKKCFAEKCFVQKCILDLGNLGTHDFFAAMLCLIIHYNAKSYITKSISAQMEQSSVTVANETNKKMIVLKEIAERLPEEIINNPYASMAYLINQRSLYQFNSLAVASLDGTSYDNQGNKVNLSDRYYFQTALAGKVSLSEVVNSKAQKVPVNVFAVPVVRNQKVAAVLWGSVRVEVFYCWMDFEELKKYGEVLVLNSEGDLVVERTDTNAERNFFTFMESTGSVNESSIQAMKEDIALGQSGCNYFEYGGQKVYYYYTDVDGTDWWMLVKVPTKTIDAFAQEQAEKIWIITGVMMVIVTLGFFQIHKRNRLMRQKLDDQMAIDPVTGGKNDIYLRKNMPTLMEEQKNYVLLGMKVMNVDNLVKVMGMEQVNNALRELYWRIHSRMKEGEVVVHHSFGKFEVLCRSFSALWLDEAIKGLTSLAPEMQLAVGVYPIEEGMVDYDQMCRYITVARNNPKEGCNYGVYTKKLYEQDIQRSQLKKDIQEGVHSQSFQPWFQPKYAADGKTIVGAEALARWYKADKILTPYHFISLAELTGQIRDIDMCVLENVCKQFRNWQALGIKPVPISVNLSRNLKAKSRQAPMAWCSFWAGQHTRLTHSAKRQARLAAACLLLFFGGFY